MHIERERTYLAKTNPEALKQELRNEFNTKDD